MTGFAFYARGYPRLASMGGGSGAADAVFVCASRRPQCAGDANCRLATPTAGGAITLRIYERAYHICHEPEPTDATVELGFRH